MTDSLISSPLACVASLRCVHHHRISCPPWPECALVASIADARSFKSGRQVSAWLGLVPRQSSSGGKPTLLGMSKRGDAYLRTLLIHGARSAILAAKNKVDNTQGWLTNLLKRRHPNIAAVALANKNVRTVWAILAHGREFRPDYGTSIPLHGAKSVYAAIDVVIAIDEANALDLGAALEDRRSTLDPQILDHDYRIAILKHIAVRVADHRRGVGT
jgi:hypothetical protein